MQGKNRTKEPVKYCKPGSIDHYLRLKKRKHVNDELLDIHVPHVDEQHQEPEIAEDDEQDLNLEMEDDVNLLPDDCEDLALEEEDLNFEEDRHEESLLSTETGKETNPEAEAEAGGMLVFVVVLLPVLTLKLLVLKLFAQSSNSASISSFGPYMAVIPFVSITLHSPREIVFEVHG
ncbi:hypothetical protein Dimus_001639 [Dionaea muscipula]